MHSRLNHRISRPHFWLGALALFLSSLISPPLDAEESKNHDLDVIREESKVPPYHLPPILVGIDGKPVTSEKQWFHSRRPEILSLFGHLVYGVVPRPESPIRTTFHILKTNTEVLEGKALRKDVRIRFENAKGYAEMVILVFTPKGSATPSPAFLLHSFSGTRDDAHDQDPTKPEQLRNGTPLGELIRHGLGLVVVPQGDLVRHNEVEFQRGIHPLFYRENQSFPDADQWGVIAAVSWSASRALDYLETDRDVDSKRVIAMGHSKMGKAALWSAAQDTRFAMAILAQSGCGGAALWKRNIGETMEKMVTRFPYWLCRNAAKFSRNEEDLPVDQHMLLACIAPRPLYVASGEDDLWADPKGEYLSAYHASEVYQLLGKQGLDSPHIPAVGTAIGSGQVGYHIRSGGHSVERYDWEKFIAFAKKHLMKP